MPNTVEWLGYLLGTYLLVLPAYYATIPDTKEVKSRLFWRAVFHLRVRRPLPQEQMALRAVLLKAFYLPLMVNWTLIHLHLVQQFLQDFQASGAFFPNGYWVIFHGLFTIDVAIFAVSYGIEHPRLGNEIRSVEPTLLGWVAALACYPPWVLATYRVLGWYTVDYPAFTVPWIQWLAGISLLVFVSLYVWATVALGLKASNLTNRGVVQTGPYAWVRHPAYVSKNLAWWVGAIPTLVVCATQDPVALVYAILGLAAWASVYYLRHY